MGTILVSENVSLDGVIQDPAGDEGFRVGGWVGLIKDRPELNKLALDEALGTEVLLAMPITFPFASSTGPPELPGFMAASVWIACATVKPFGASMVRSTPETMPVLMLRS